MSAGPPNPYLSNSMQGPGSSNTYHALRHMDGNQAGPFPVGGGSKPNSKKHNRTLSDDDRVMEVEGFTDSGPNNTNPGSTSFQNKSNSIRNDGDPHHGWSPTDQSHQEGGMTYDQNGVPVGSNYELAASKPMNSSRGIMNRRF